MAYEARRIDVSIDKTFKPFYNLISRTDQGNQIKYATHLFYKLLPKFKSIVNTL